MRTKIEAEQAVIPVVDPPVTMSLTVTLEGDVARLWRNYMMAFQELKPSKSQVAAAMIALGLRRWKEFR